MHFNKKNASQKRLDLVNSLKSKKLLRFPGAYNPLCAKLIAEIGFDGIYISGGVMANDLGIPDIGLTTLDHVSYRSSQISQATDLPSSVEKTLKNQMLNSGKPNMYNINEGSPTHIKNKT